MRLIEESALRRRLSLSALIGADAISLTGNALTQIAVPWFVLTTTGSAARTGLVAFCGLLPLILAAFLGGAVVDRLGRRRMSVIADVASMVCVAAIPLLYARHALAFWQLLALVFVRGMLDAPGTTARAALLPELAARARLSLMRANTIHEVIESGSQLLGPALAGVLVYGLGANNVLWVDAATYAASAALIAAAVPRATLTAERPERSYRHDLVEGLRFVFRDPPIRAIFVSATVLNFLISPLLAVILPVYMKETYNNAASLGLVIAAFGGGSVLGAIAYGVIGDRFARRSTFIAGVAGIGAAIATLAALPPVPIMVGAMLLGGMISGPNGPLVSTVLQERTPEGLRGRVSGTTTAIGFAAAPLGVAMAGYVVDAIGVRPTLIGSAVLFLGVICALVYDRGLGGMDDARNGQR